VYLISLSLKKIQDILRIDNDCFNFGIRILACDKVLQLVEPDVHYMDLRFYVSYYNYYNMYFYCYYYLSK
jgi:hypothetical protein